MKTRLIFLVHGLAWLQMTCAAAGDQKNEPRAPSSIQREQYMQTCDGFVNRNRNLIIDFVQNVCDVTKHSPNESFSTDIAPPSALWMCPSNRCRAYTLRRHSKCTTCDMQSTFGLVCPCVCLGACARANGLLTTSHLPYTPAVLHGTKGGVGWF